MKTTQHEKLVFNIEELVHKYSINQQQLRLPSSLTLFLGLSGFREISFNSWKSWAPVKTWTTPGTSGRLQISALTRSIQNEQFNPRWMFSDCDGELDYTERKLRHEISSRDQTSDLFCCKARSLPTHPVNTPPPKNKRNPEMKTRIRLFSKSIFYSDGNKPPGMHGLVKQRAQNNYRVLWLTAAVIVWKRLHGQQWRQDLKNWQYIQSCHIFGRDIKQGYKKPLAFQRTNISCLRRQTSGNFHD